jgi:hypothetical protein
MIADPGNGAELTPVARQGHPQPSNLNLLHRVLAQRFGGADIDPQGLGHGILRRSLTRTRRR